jgi:hypothetical protein
LALALFLCGGCIDNVPLDPTGDDTSIEGVVRVRQGGSAAAALDDDVCAQMGSVAVQALIADPGGERRYADSRLRVDCSSGRFDTRPHPVLAHGEYEVQWVSVDPGGILQYRSPPLDFRPLEGEHAVMPTAVFDLFDPRGDEVSLAGRVELRGPDDGGFGAPSQARCDGARTSELRLEVYPRAQRDRVLVTPELTVPCEQGALDTRPARVLARGDYRGRWVAVSDSGVVLARGETFRLDLREVEHVELETARLRVRDRTARWRVRTRFEREGQLLSCAEVGATQRSWDLRGPEGTRSGSDECSGRIVLDDLPLDVYELSVTASGSEGTFEGQCTLRVGLAEGVREDCLLR